jgi:hypothetical protein
MDNFERKQPERRIPPPYTGAKPMGGMLVVGINLLVLVFYTLLLKLTTGNFSAITDAFILFLHVLFCIGMAIGRSSWVWLLGGVLVLIVGFSTCVWVADMH